FAQRKSHKTHVDRVQEADVYAPVVAANNDFAVRFFKAAYQDSPRQNVMTAPASWSYAFALLLNGSQAAGRDQIADVLDLKNIPLGQINRANAALHAIRRSHIAKRPRRKPGPQIIVDLHAGEDLLVDADGRSFQPYKMSGALWVKGK